MLIHARLRGHRKHDLHILYVGVAIQFLVQRLLVNALHRVRLL